MSIVRGEVYAWHHVDGCVHIRGKKEKNFEPEEWEKSMWETEIKIPEKIWKQIILREFIDYIENELLNKLKESKCDTS